MTGQAPAGSPGRRGRPARTGRLRKESLPGEAPDGVPKRGPQMQCSALGGARGTPRSGAPAIYRVWGPRRPLRDRDGLSLIEMTVSLAILSIVAAAIGSAILIAGKAVPDGSGPAQCAIRAAGAADRIAAELQYATAVTAYTDKCIEFILPDRNGDGNPEAVRYEWSGLQGDPLTCTWNKGTARTVLTDVRQFRLDFNLQTVSRQRPSGNESGEILLAGNEAVTDLGDYGIKNGQYGGQYFKPSLPADALSWSITRVKFKAKSTGADKGITNVQLCDATAGGLPGDSLLGEQLLDESTLPKTYVWQEFTFVGIGGLHPDRGACLVLSRVLDSVSCKVEYQNKNATAPDTVLLKSTDQGVTWSQQTGQSLQFYVYGTVTTAGTPIVQNTCYLKGASLVLRAGKEAASAVRTYVSLVNCPEVSG